MVRNIFSTISVGRLLEWVLLARGNERIFTVSAPLVCWGTILVPSGGMMIRKGSEVMEFFYEKG